MNDLFKRFLSLTLAILMVVSYIPTSAFASETETCEHSYDSVTTATCVDAGTTTYTCSACGDTYSEDTAAIGHNYVAGEVVEATCEDAGSIPYTCANCGDTYTEEIAAGHNYEVTGSVAATCEAGGSDTKTCTVCGDVTVEEVDALGHDYQDGTCANCGGAEPVVMDEGEEETPAYVAQVGDVKYEDIQEAIVAAVPAGTVELLSDVTVDEWVMITQSLTIGTDQLITVDEINGLTIDGNHYSLTIKSIESASNGGYLFFDATELNVKDLTINCIEAAANLGGICLTSGEITNVTFNGGKGVHPGAGNITITGCTFNTNGSAIYNEVERDNLVVTGNTFNTAAGQYAIYLRGNTTFTNNTVVTGKVNVTNSATGTISGNNFGTERFKVYNGAKATISNNTINNLVFNDETDTQATFTGNTLSAEAEAALEAVTPAPVYAAQVDGVDYETLQAAINAADGKTVTLLANIELTDTVTVPAGKTVTLDLNGKTISQTKAQTAAYQMILNDGNLTIEDSVGGGKISYTDSGNGGEYVSNTITNRGTLTLKSGTIENLSSTTVASNGYPYAIDTSIWGAATEVNTIIEGGEVTCANYSALRLKADSETEPVNITITGGKVNGRIEVQNPTSNKATVGKLTISGGEINKNNSSKAIMIFGGGGTAKNMEVAISGGTITGEIGYSNSFPITGFDENVISGGTFNTDVSEWCVDGFECKKNDDGTYGVKEAAPAYVAQIGEQGYESLQAAIDAADGKTVTLLTDVVLDDTVTIAAGKTVTLDLAGYTISQTKAQTAAYQMILNDGNLTIEDSVGGGKISYTDSGNGGEYVSNTITNRGTLTLVSGTIENLSSATVASNGYPHAVDTYSGIRDTSVTINGGTIYCAEYSAIRMFCVSATYKADLVINGGTIKGAVDMQNGSSAAALGSLTINGGTFETTKNANNIRFANWGGNTYGITASIKGGSFNGGITTAYVPAAANWNSKIITGGIFTTDMSAFCADGFECKENADGTYGVVVETLSGAGTEADPYIIDSLSKLKLFAKMVNAGDTFAGKYVKLTADIDLNGEAWTPIATFNGYFDGGNNTISNLVINGGSNSNQGFFGQTNNGEIKNLTINNAKVTGRLNVGVVAGTPYTSKYTNIKVTGHVEVNGMAYVGGVGGKNAYANWTNITVDVDSTSYVKATSTENGIAYRTYVGGVIGFIGEGGHTFKNISSNIKVIGDVCDIGGLFGIAHYGNNFEGVTFTGSVEAPVGAEEVGGIAGVWHNEKGTTVTFTNVTSTGTVTIGTETTTGSVVGGAYNAENETPSTSGSLIIDGEEAWLAVAKIGDVKYTTLAEVIAAAQPGETVTLVDDVVLTEALVIPAAATTFSLRSNTGITLDLAGKTISQTKAQTEAYSMIVNNGDLTILDSVGGGKISYTDSGNGGEYVSNTILNNGTLTVESGTIENLSSETVAKNGYPQVIDTNGVLTINGGTISCANYSAVRIWCTTDDNTAVTINGGTFTGSVDLHNVNGNANKGSLSIAGGTFNENGFTNKVIRLVNFGEAVDEMSIAISGGTVNGAIGISGSKKDETLMAKVTAVSGGTFTTAVPKEYCAAGYIPTSYTDDNGNTVYGVKQGSYVAEVNGTEYDSITAAIAAANNGDTITMLADTEITETVVVDKDITLDLNGKTVTNAAERGNHAFRVAADMTVKNGTIDSKASGYTFIVGYNTPEAGNLTIESGKYYGLTTVVSVTYGSVTINGGYFEATEYQSAHEFTFNCVDRFYTSGEAKITVKGGTFYNFNPFDNAAEGNNTNFVAEGYAALPDLNGNYVVGVKPTATVNDLGALTVDAGDYVVYPSGANTADMPLSFVMQFLADQTEEDMETSPYAEWYGDFVITFTGIEKGSFTADGCYLAGHYGSYGWVKVPVDGMTIEAGVRYPVMLGVGMGQKYDYICSGVQDFKCALYLTPEILEANPNLQVKLELAVVDNSQGSVTAANALVNNENVYSVTDYTYEAEDFLPPVAQIGDKYFTTLQEAVNEGGEITVLTDIELTDTVTVAAGKTVTLDLNGKTVSMVYATDATANHQMILNKGNLTIQDNVGDGKLSYKYTGADLGTSYYANTITSDAGSTLTVKSGAIENLTYDSGIIAYAVDGLTNGGIGDVTVNIEGGTITSKRQAVRIFANSTTKTGTLNISDGVITGRVIVQNANASANKAALSITGGTFNANEYKTDVLYVGGNNGATIDMTPVVSGGIFNGEISATVPTGFISGGTYSNAVPEAYCAEGYIPADNGDGTYGVKVGSYVARNTTTGVGYETLAAAIDAAKADETIKLLADVTVTSNVIVNKAITIDGNNHSININAASKVYILETTSDCTIQNVNLNAVGAKTKGVKLTNGNVVFDNVTISSPNADALTVNGNLTLKTYFKASTSYTTIEARNGVVNAEANTVFDMTKWGANVRPATSDLKSVVDVNGDPFFCAYSSTSYYKTMSGVLNATDLTLLDDVKLTGNITVKGTLDLNGNDLTVVEGKVIKVSSTLTLTGKGEVNGEFSLTAAAATLTAPEGLNVTTSVADYKVVYKNGAYKLTACVAKIGDVLYETLDAAIEAVAENGTITILSDIAEAPEKFIGKNITVDVNGKSLWLVDALKALKAIAADDYNVVDNSNGTYTFEKAQVVVDGEARIGETVYATLAEAINAANAGDNINILKNIETKPDVTIAKVVTIVNAGGYKLWADNNMDALKAILANGYVVTDVMEMGMIYSITAAPVVAEPVAKIGETTYTTVEAALKAAKSGETVVMIADSDESDTYLNVTEGISLDLAGYTLKARSLAGFQNTHVYDSKESRTSGTVLAKLVLPKGNLSLDENNSELPFWDTINSCYIFLAPDTRAAKNYQYFKSGTVTDDSFTMAFRPGFGYSGNSGIRMTYLADGVLDNEVTIKVRASWTDSEGTEISQIYKYEDDMAGRVYNDNYGIFTIMMYGLSDIDTVDMNVIITTSSGVSYVGETLTYNYSE